MHQHDRTGDFIAVRGKGVYSEHAASIERILDQLNDSVMRVVRADVQQEKSRRLNTSPCRFEGWGFSIRLTPSWRKTGIPRDDLTHRSNHSERLIIWNAASR